MSLGLEPHAMSWPSKFRLIMALLLLTVIPQN
jgi:hypothetical protein